MKMFSQGWIGVIRCLFLCLTFTIVNAGNRPNIILYVTDDQGSLDAGCYGNSVIKTPGLDNLASQGMRFTNGFAAVSSCSSSRACLLTGLYSHANGQYGLHHSFHNFYSLPNIKSLPALLAEAGYRTIIAGKYHVGPSSVYPFQHAVNRYLDEGATYILPDEAAELCREFIAAKSDQPFFLYFCPKEPHSPFYRQKADPIDAEDVIMPPYLADTPVFRERMAKFYMSMQQADLGLVKLIEILKETKQWDRTIIVFCSDNGAPFPGAKTNLYDPGIRLPLVIRTPSMKQEALVSDAMVSWVDITPTLLDLAAVDVADVKFQGRSFASILKGEKSDLWNEIYASQTFHQVTFYYPMRAIRTRRYKLIWNVEYVLNYPGPVIENRSLFAESKKVFAKRSIQSYVKRPQFELYDLEKDPDEVVNLAANEAYADIFEDLTLKLKNFIETTNDPWAIKWPKMSEEFSSDIYKTTTLQGKN
jgi:N-sulfoglucosamine sulfohydrolase